MQLLSCSCNKPSPPPSSFLLVGGILVAEKISHHLQVGSGNQDSESLFVDPGCNLACRLVKRGGSIIEGRYRASTTGSSHPPSPQSRLSNLSVYPTWTLRTLYVCTHLCWYMPAVLCDEGVRVLITWMRYLQPPELVSPVKPPPSPIRPQWP